MPEARKSRTLREKYGEELRLRRLAAGLTQEALSEVVVCSPTLISHFEAGRRLPNPEDARRLDQALGTDGYFLRWLGDLDPKFVDYFAAVAELERHAAEIRQYGHSLIPGLLQTEAYARALFRAYRPNHRPEEVDESVVTRMTRARLLDSPSGPVAWTLLDEAAIRRQVGGPRVMAEQLRKIADMGERGRVRLHILPFKAGEHALLGGMLYLMSFDDAPPVAYAEGLMSGNLIDDPALVSQCQASYDLALGDALSHKESLTLIRNAAEEHEHDQQ
ncbi:helix-turn-helix transcriptional regulator [Streptomyces sp. NBC_01317]|uniref:helix-turn-helix domain-containing protein n=1 Tax=Streptomyces sp. NBC_01317 TaxID=2903822 RepID=UPI002E0E0C79|nr:helix-turn-helix transcriptional regulator [Streptomyces sp. NBC_01317]